MFDSLGIFRETAAVHASGQQITAECKYRPLSVSGRLLHIRLKGNSQHIDKADLSSDTFCYVFFPVFLTQTRSLYFLPGAASAGHGGGRHEYPSGQEGPHAERFPHLPVPA